MYISSNAIAIAISKLRANRVFISRAIFLQTQTVLECMYIYVYTYVCGCVRLHIIIIAILVRSPMMDVLESNFHISCSSTAIGAQHLKRRDAFDCARATFAAFMRLHNAIDGMYAQ